jgi:hypothetical protein
VSDQGTAIVSCRWWSNATFAYHLVHRLSEVLAQREAAVARFQAATEERELLCRILYRQGIVADGWQPARSRGRPRRAPSAVPQKSEEPNKER